MFPILENLRDSQLFKFAYLIPIKPLWNPLMVPDIF